MALSFDCRRPMLRKAGARSPRKGTTDDQLAISIDLDAQYERRSESRRRGRVDVLPTDRSDKHSQDTPSLRRYTHTWMTSIFEVFRCYCALASIDNQT
jgi:hypothetical protein